MEEKAQAAIQEIKPIIPIYVSAIATVAWAKSFTTLMMNSVSFRGWYSWVSKTGETIRNLRFQRLQAFGTDAPLLAGQVVFVSDQGANIVAALCGYAPLNCNAHILNVTLSSAFAPDVLNKTPELAEM